MSFRKKIKIQKKINKKINRERIKKKSEKILFK
jgi:hypothetical protein